METYLNALSLGLGGDGEQDCTSALQRAMDELSEAGGGTIFFPTGRYRTGALRVRPNITLSADAAWPYGPSSNAVLLPVSDDQPCVLDLSHANGASIVGLCIEGENRGTHMCGILMDKEAFGPREDCFRIEKCKIMRFSGHAAFLDKVWCFSVRSCMLAFCGGDGLRIHGWDAFVLDNWFSGNRGAGFGTEGPNSSVTMTGNRIEWNVGGGIVIRGGSHYNITGNYIDRSGAGGIVLLPRETENGMDFTNTITVTGNIVYRSGKNLPEGSLRSAHIIADRAAGTAITGNSLCFGQDDGQGLGHSPENGMILRGLYNCVVSENTLMACATKRVIYDMGGHEAGTIIRDNPGSIVDISEKSKDELKTCFSSSAWLGTEWYDKALGETVKFE